MKDVTETTSNVLYREDGVLARHCRCRNLIALDFLGIHFHLSVEEMEEFHGNLGQILRHLSRHPEIVQDYRVGIRNENREISHVLTHGDVSRLHAILDSIRLHFDAERAAFGGIAV